MASEGAYIVCSDLTPDLRPGGYETDTAPTHKVVARSSKSVFKRTDASSPEDMEAVVQTAVENFGRLDMYVQSAGICLNVAAKKISRSIVNNAGIFCGQNRIAEESIEAFDKTMVGHLSIPFQRKTTDRC